MGTIDPRIRDPSTPSVQGFTQAKPEGAELLELADTVTRKSLTPTLAGFIRAKPAVAGLVEVADTIRERGYVTSEQMAFIKLSADRLNAPPLEIPDHTDTAAFNELVDLAKTSSTTRPHFPIGSGKNAFLSCSAVLMLFIMSSNIISLCSQMQLAENLFKAKLAMVMKDMAIEAAAATTEGGKIEALKELAQAAKAAADAGIAIGQIFTSITMAFATKIEENRVTAQYRLDSKIPDGQALSSTDRTQISRQVEMNMAPLKGTVDGLIQAFKSINEEQMHKTLAKLDIDAAVQRATGELLNKLMDIVSQSVSMLSKSADTDMAKTIQAMMETMTTAIRTYGEIGSRG